MTLAKHIYIKNNILKKIQLHHLVSIIFFIVFCLISLVNHYNYRSYALDLGLFNQSIWNYAHFQNANYSIADELYTCQLGDHFSLYFILISPFCWIFGSYTLLIFQIVAIIIGGYGIYKFAQLKFEENKILPLLFMVQFYGIWGIISALSYDYHDNVVAAMFVPWFIYYFKIGNWKRVVLFFILIIISKENMALWLGFICAGLFISNFKSKKHLMFSVVLGLLAIIYFILVVKIILPTINSGHGYVHLSYSVLGDNPIKTFLNDPLHLIKLFLNNHLNNPYFDGIKEETFTIFLLSGGVLLFLRPDYLIMLIPIFAQKMFSDDAGKWGINGHYSIEFVPIITMGAIEVIAMLKKSPKIALMPTVLLIWYTYKSNYDKLEIRTSLYYSKVHSQFYDKSHYECSYNISAINEATKLIPDDAKICATSMLLPHIYNHKYIYQYPINKDANCFFLLENPELLYMYTKEDLDKHLSLLRTDNTWTTLYDKQGVCLFIRK